MNGTAAQLEPLDLAVMFNVVGRPQQRGSKVPVRDRTGGVLVKNGNVILKDSNDKSTPWMAVVANAGHRAWGKKLLTEPIGLSVVFRFKRPKAHYGTGSNANKLKPSAPEHHAQTPDLAKLVRCLEDALSGVVWRDDRQVCRYVEPMTRVWTSGAEGAFVRIYTIRDTPEQQEESNENLLF